MTIEYLLNLPYSEQVNMADKVIFAVNIDGETKHYDVAGLRNLLNKNPLMLAFIAAQGELHVQAPIGFVQFGKSAHSDLTIIEEYYIQTNLEEGSEYGRVEPIFGGLLSDINEYTYFEMLHKRGLKQVFDPTLHNTYAEVASHAAFMDMLLEAERQEREGQEGKALDTRGKDAIQSTDIEDGYSLTRDQYFHDFATGGDGFIKAGTLLSYDATEKWSFYDTAEERDTDLMRINKERGPLKAVKPFNHDQTGKTLSVREAAEGVTRLMRALAKEPYLRNNNGL